ncbi:KDGP aldolase [Jeongeupia sp. USM3]|uniref:2-dehydro-3-deoxy-phosphogluconate aldolase n=1 Tax=Jeongeupia sp. USM3 TaxID=1906741 RepID=UPI00089DDA4B|nr:KDGP aldolase [Jeongeupia sp. USM3]AOY00037.1 4-hydroxy-2-ketovalerate aldolase [Jeongeupia sp. USM3]
MMQQAISFYHDRVAINVLARDLDNAAAAFEAAEGHAAIGLLSARFDTVEEGVVAARQWQDRVCVSVGLGAGDPTQYYKAAMIAAATAPGHVNQTFSGAGFAAGALAARGVTNTRINALIRPTGTPGKVIVSTGVAGSGAEVPALVDTDTAVLMIRDQGAHAAKFFPMGGLKSLAELEVLAKSCARHGLEMIEPTGGIDLANFGEILQVCLDAGVPKVMPHVYSSIIDKESGNTRPADVAELLQMVKQRV